MITTSERELARYMGGLDHAKPRKRGTGLHGSPRRVDKNQRQIVAELRQAGCSVTDTHTLGAGFPDLVVGWGGLTWLFECKTDTGTLTEDERTWFDEWRGQAAVIRSAEDALRAMGRIP